MGEHLTEELLLQRAVLEAQRALVRIERPGDARAALIRFVEELGGSVQPAHVGGPGSLPIDLSLGDDDAIVPVAPEGSLANEHLARALPELLLIARHMSRLVEAAGHGRRLEDLDLLTGWPRRDRLLAAAELSIAGADRFVGVALSRPRRDRDRYGRAHVDVLVRRIARLVDELRHPSDHRGRLTGPGVALLVVRADPARLRDLSAEVTTRWSDLPDVEVGLRIAEVTVSDRPADDLARLEAELELVGSARREVPREVEH